MRRPSGNQRGIDEEDSNEVSCTGFEPSPLDTQISSWPDRCELNAILEPSGEYCATRSSRVEAISFSAVLGLSPTDSCARQMSMFQFPTPYTRRFPCREMVGEKPCSPIEARGCGSLERDIGTLHSLASRSQGWLTVQMISCPSEVQAGLSTHGCGSSRSCSSPAGRQSSESGST